MIVWFAVDPSPSPSPAQVLDSTTVTPGTVGFLATFALALAAIVLIQLLTRSLRRTARNAREQGLQVTATAAVGQGVQLPVRGPEPTVPGVLDGGAPFAATAVAADRGIGEDGADDGAGDGPRDGLGDGLGDGPGDGLGDGLGDGPGDGLGDGDGPRDGDPRA